LKLQTIADKFTRGVKLTRENHRAGYGFDFIIDQGGGQFKALKGGALSA
jgi:hypothetical protein